MAWCNFYSTIQLHSINLVFYQFRPQLMRMLRALWVSAHARSCQSWASPTMGSPRPFSVGYFFFWFINVSSPDLLDSPITFGLNCIYPTVVVGLRPILFCKKVTNAIAKGPPYNFSLLQCIWPKYRLTYFVQVEELFEILAKWRWPILEFLQK